MKKIYLFLLATGMSHLGIASDSYVVCKDLDRETVMLQFEFPNLGWVRCNVNKDGESIYFMLAGAPGDRDSLLNASRRAGRKLERLNFVKNVIVDWVPAQKRVELVVSLSEGYRAIKSSRVRRNDEMKVVYFNLHYKLRPAARIIKYNKFFLEFNPAFVGGENLLNSNIKVVSRDKNSFKVTLEKPPSKDLRRYISRYLRYPFSILFGGHYANGELQFNIVEYAEGIRFSGVNLEAVSDIGLLDVQSGQVIKSFAKPISVRDFFRVVFENHGKALLGSAFFIKAGNFVYSSNFKKFSAKYSHLDVPLDFVFAEFETDSRRMAANYAKLYEESGYRGHGKKRSTFLRRLDYLDLMRDRWALHDFDGGRSFFCRDPQVFYKFIMSLGCGMENKMMNQVSSNSSRSTVDFGSTADASKVNEPERILIKLPRKEFEDILCREPIPSQAVELPKTTTPVKFARSFLHKKFRAFYYVERELNHLFIRSKPIFVRSGDALLPHASLPGPLRDILEGAVHNPMRLLELIQDTSHLHEPLRESGFMGFEPVFKEDHIYIDLKPVTYSIKLVPEHQTTNNFNRLLRLAARLGWERLEPAFYRTTKLESLKLPDDTPFVVKKGKGGHYFLIPKNRPVDVVVRFFHKPFQITPANMEQVYRPVELQVFFGDQLVDLVKKGRYDYQFRVSMDANRSMNDQLAQLSFQDVEGRYTAKAFAISHQKKPRVDVLLSDRDDRVLLIYYPLQYETSYRVVLLNMMSDSIPEKISYSILRYLDIRLLDLVNTLETEQIYDRIFVRLAEDSKYFRQVGGDFPDRYLFGAREKYSTLDYAWAGSVYNMDYRTLVGGSTTSVDILYFGVFRNNVQIENHFRNSLENVRLLFVNFVDDRVQRRIDTSRLRLENLYYQEVHLDALLGEDEVLDYNAMRAFFTPKRK